MKNIFLIITLLITLSLNGQVMTLYTEDFSNDWKKGAITYGGVSPSQPTDGNWSWVNVGSPDNDGGSASSWDDMGFIDGAAVMSSNGSNTSTLTFRWNDVNNGSSSNRVDWFSKTINGSYMSITASLSYAIGNGSSANSVWAYYQIDGGTWTLFGSSVNQSTASGTFTSSTLTCSSSIKLKVVAQTRDYNLAYVNIDNVQIAGCAVVVPSVSISSIATTICSGTSITFTATPTNGGSVPAYQWKNNGFSVGTNSSTYTNSNLDNGDVITCVMTANNTCQTSSTATSNSITMTVSQLSVGGSVISDQVVLYGDDASTINLTGNTGSVLKWQYDINSNFSTATDVPNTTTFVNGTSMGGITQTLYYRAVVQNGVCPSTNSAYATITSQGGLPIKLLYFKGTHTELGNVIEWETATEENNDYFTIYRSSYPINWDGIVRINGNGNSSMNHYYKFIDTGDFNGVFYYMLRQTDYNGQFSEHEIISINCNDVILNLNKITNIIGQDVDINTPGLKILHYSDGRNIKQY